MQYTGNSAQEQGLDPTPEHVFIKVFPARLRALVRQYGLTRAELGELLLLACYIDEHGTCFPGKRDSVEKVGKKSGKWARALHRKLERKGVIRIVAGGTVGRERYAPTFYLPDAFIFGGDSYQRRNSAPGGGRNSAPEGGRNSALSEAITPTPNKNQKEQEPESTEKQHNSTDASRAAVSGAERAQIAQQLMKAGVKPREAILISRQYSTALIEETLREAARGGIANKGGWIRVTIERKAGRAINYPDNDKALQQQIAETAAALAVKQQEEERVDPYLRGEYFKRERDYGEG